MFRLLRSRFLQIESTHDRFLVIESPIHLLISWILILLVFLSSWSSMPAFTPAFGVPLFWWENRIKLSDQTYSGKCVGDLTPGRLTRVKGVLIKSDWGSRISPLNDYPVPEVARLSQILHEKHRSLIPDARIVEQVRKNTSLSLIRLLFRFVRDKQLNKYLWRLLTVDPMALISDAAPVMSMGGKCMSSYRMKRRVASCVNGSGYLLVHSSHRLSPDTLLTNKNLLRMTSNELVIKKNTTSLKSSPWIRSSHLAYWVNRTERWFEWQQLQ